MEQEVERVEVVGVEGLDHRGGAADLGEGAELLLALAPEQDLGRDLGALCELIAQLLAEEATGLEDGGAHHDSVFSSSVSAASWGCLNLPRSQMKGPAAT